MGSNWEWSYRKGRDERMKQEVDARMHNMPFDPRKIPLHSHCGTMQSHFNKGWQSVRSIDIQLRVDGQQSYKNAREALKKRFGESNGR
ncbi:hypothetical protein [Pseudoalteromonas prydzensis]|uniref:hypothetical protein n=1 Tax=Pseudoalteromonas prydzensis TaxID=182141 RepID=UPI0007E517A1|nr:hypothetical protein [Pseudoalteromonas prydzensis]MBE0378489.1 hypothetical protein [Pseudoalteromonas prydzensis ACAM 620]